MLVLSRKKDQEILLGENIRLRVISIRGGTVRVGIEAPRSVNIKRGELVANCHLLPISGQTDWYEKDLPAGTNR